MQFYQILQHFFKKSFSALLVVTVLAASSFADENIITTPKITDTKIAVNLPEPNKINGDYIKGYYSDTANILLSPVTWNGDEWLTATLVVGTTSGLYIADTEIRDFARKNQNSINDSFASIGNSIGNPLFILPNLGLFYLYGHFNDDATARSTALLALESLTISAAMTMALKVATHRSRPYTNEKSTSWDGPGINDLNSSFPSIHTQSAFSVASVIAEEYDTNQYIPSIAYGLATLTALSRIYSDKHWASDAFLGAALGYFTGKAIVSYHPLQQTNGVKIQPIATQNGFGVIAEYRF